jgi:hypothetical protein
MPNNPSHGPSTHRDGVGVPCSPFKGEVDVDDDAPDGDAGDARASVRSTSGGGSVSSGGPSSSGGSSPGGPLGGGRRKVMKASEESRQARAESAPPIVPSEG